MREYKNRCFGSYTTTIFSDEVSWYNVTTICIYHNIIVVTPYQDTSPLKMVVV